MFGITLGVFVGLAAACLVYYGMGMTASRSTQRTTAVLVFIACVLIGTLFTSVVRVGTGEIAVMTRFGRVTGQELGEGIHFKNPLDVANKYDVKIQKREIEAAAASADLQDVTAILGVNFKLRMGAVSEIHRTVGTDFEDKLIGLAIQEVFKASTARFDAIQLITDRSRVKQVAVGSLRERLQSFGIEVIDLSIINFSFSSEFTTAIEQKQVAQQNAERAKFNLDAARTDAEAQRVQSETLSPLFLQKLFLEKWNGVLPQVVGSENSLLLDFTSQTRPN
jgi:regulator of protease activity HflC (stomatin/prohibitin superfamily)